MEQAIQRLASRVYNLEYLLCCLNGKLDALLAINSTEDSKLDRIIRDIETAQGGIDTANTGIDTANEGISILSVDVGTANQGIDDANAAIAAIDCGSCDLTEVNDKLDKLHKECGKIVKELPKLKCRFPGGGPDNDKKETKK